MEPELEISRIKNILHEMIFRLDEICTEIAVFNDSLTKVQDALGKLQYEITIDKFIRGNEGVDDDE